MISGIQETLHRARGGPHDEQARTYRGVRVRRSAVPMCEWTDNKAIYCSIFPELFCLGEGIPVDGRLSAEVNEYYMSHFTHKFADHVRFIFFRVNQVGRVFVFWVLLSQDVRVIYLKYMSSLFLACFYRCSGTRIFLVWLQGPVPILKLSIVLLV